MKKWIVGVYRRLSADEVNEEGESNSVANQKKLIDNYLIDKSDIKVYKYYCDDGYTGTDFNRPGYKEMLEDIQNKKINGIIIKDLSRLGRNYIEVGDFIDEIVPKYRLRFISVNDNVDSYKNPNVMESLEIPFKNLMNESYSRDTSKKMRSSLKASKKSGNFIGKVAPYGYIKDSEDGHKFIIDEDSAGVVKKIFDMALKGTSKIKIAKELNDNHIPTPSNYLRDRIKYDFSLATDKWNTRTLDHILKNETYIGSLVQGKKTRISHKTHNFITIAEDEWIIVKNHHKPIIKEEVFNQVQDIIYNRNVRVNKKGNLHKYTGFIKCADCGSNMYRLTRTKRGVNQVYYYCSSYLKEKNCTGHYILESAVDEVVISVLNHFINLVCNAINKVENLSISRIEYNSELKKIRLVELEKEIDRYKILLDDVLNDYKLDFISKEDFEDFNSSYMYELNKLRLEKEAIEKEKNKNDSLDWINKFKKAGTIAEINRNVVDEFIENIYIHEDKNIEIKLRFKNQYEDLLKCLKNQNIMI